MLSHVLIGYERLMLNVAAVAAGVGGFAAVGRARRAVRTGRTECRAGQDGARWVFGSVRCPASSRSAMNTAA